MGRALGDVAQAVLDCLADGDKTIPQLAATTGHSVARITDALAWLRQGSPARVLLVGKQGRLRVFRVRPMRRTPKAAPVVRARAITFAAFQLHPHFIKKPRRIERRRVLNIRTHRVKG